MTNDGKHGCEGDGEGGGGLLLRWLHSGWRGAQSYAVAPGSPVNNRSSDGSPFAALVRNLFFGLCDQLWVLESFPLTVSHTHDP